ncbi:MAG: PilN domain-containing protein [Bacillati bacterium ANGP1]|uniref:PilN domain-containing protein n=1 Tax=Candidatus Segetimicrobium genomatis TaxID=2569760 RepID=A0A537L0J7_9BACT|nr:MAG: PilN domain-containing protein [Terrabacteria group bacterium ANGP1]
MIRINLLPRERVRRPTVAPRVLVGLAFVVVVAALVLATLALNLRNARVRAQIDDVNVRIEELKPKVAEVEALQRQIAEARRKEQLLRQLEGLRIPWDNVLNELRKIMPADVWLIRIDARGDGNLTFNGFGMSYEAVARFMVNLDGSPLFQGADLTIGQKQNQAGHDVINFSVTASLTPRQKEVGVR